MCIICIVLEVVIKLVTKCRFGSFINLWGAGVWFRKMSLYLEGDTLIPSRKRRMRSLCFGITHDGHASRCYDSKNLVTDIIHLGIHWLWVEVFFVCASVSIIMTFVCWMLMFLESNPWSPLDSSSRAHPLWFSMVFFCIQYQLFLPLVHMAGGSDCIWMGNNLFWFTGG